MYKLQTVSEHLRRSKIMSRDLLKAVVEPDPGRGETSCTKTVSVTPMSWMESDLGSGLAGPLFCPQCSKKIGNFSWVVGAECGCGASLAPSFTLDLTALIFKTGGRHLHSSSGRAARGDRRPVVV